MKTKVEIVQRLLDSGMIDAEEAVVLLSPPTIIHKETFQFEPWPQYPVYPNPNTPFGPYYITCGQS
jgi:hypothetical protein